jgi:tRNA pseudouridine13 synthase
MNQGYSWIMTYDPLSPLPLLTADLPGIGGRIKVSPEDFEVEEIPAYQPSGSGEFLYLWIEKRGTGAEYFVRQLARKLDLSVGEIGTAGLKDRQAVTRQMVSVPVRAEPLLDRINDENTTLLQVSRHANKLRPGHLHGNRFRVLIRDPAPDTMVLSEAIVDRLRKQGLPNYFGPQRFGREGETLERGFAMVRRVPGAARCSPFLRKLALSAVQSALFNRYLASRLSDGLLRQVLPGDVMAKRPKGGIFVVADVAREQERFEAGETVPAGPIFGRKTFPAAGVAAEREAAVLADAGLTAGSFTGFGKLLQGTRRQNLVFPDNLEAKPDPAGIRLTFGLPAGSYATVLLREVMKVEMMEADVAG